MITKEQENLIEFIKANNDTYPYNAVGCRHCSDKDFTGPARDACGYRAHN